MVIIISSNMLGVHKIVGLPILNIEIILTPKKLVFTYFNNKVVARSRANYCRIIFVSLGWLFL